MAKRIKKGLIFLDGKLVCPFLYGYENLQVEQSGDSFTIRRKQVTSNHIDSTGIKADDKKEYLAGEVLPERVI